MCSCGEITATTLETSVQGNETSVPALMKKAWVTRVDQWESHYTTISHLYLVECMHLKDVVKFMSEQYDFHATEKQYKHRIKRWGLRKKLTSREAQEAWHSAASRQKLQLPIVQGRQLGSQKLKSFMVNKANSPAKQPDFPDNIKATHHALSAINVYSSGWSEQNRGIGDEDSQGDRTRFWWIRMMLAASKIENRRSSTNAFKVIDECCAQYQHLLRNDDAILVYCTYSAMVKLASVGEDLAMLFAKFITELSSIVLGSSHPISFFWVNLQKMGISEAREALLPIMKAYFDVVYKALGGQLHLVSTLFLNDCQHRIGPFDSAEALAATKSAINKLRQDLSLGGKYLKYWKKWAQLLPSLMINDVECPVAWQCDRFFNKSDQWASEEEVVEESLEFDVLPVIAMVEELHGRYSSAEWHYEYALDLATQRYIKGHPRILRAYDDLEQHKCRRHQNLL